jgi:hypothetical protein
MIRGFFWGVLACVLLAMTACVAPLPEGESGLVAMIPFTNEEYGIRGNAPMGGWSDRAVLIQESFPGTMDDLVELAVAQTDLVRLPRSTGTYRGAYLTWDLYTFSTRVEDAGPDIYRVDMGLAHVERDARYYLVFLIAQPMDYEANKALYQTVFEHALYALEPLG